MSDPIPMAKSAREALARALGALQADASVPPDLLAVAEPVSQAMGALFRIERTQGASLPAELPVTLDAVRRALAMLQAQPSQHPAVGMAMEAVAGSLGLVHGLSRAVPKTEPEPPPPAPPVQPIAHTPPPQPVQPVYAQPVAPAPVPQPAPPPQPIAAASPPVPADALRVEVALATHSASNFYKGLSGNDIVQHGGIFVATYRVPRIGQQVALRVLLPGGYELDALGIVAWTRETHDPAASVEPGYGARLTHISDEGRRLVERYVRNREPMFYDDL